MAQALEGVDGGTSQLGARVAAHETLDSFRVSGLRVQLRVDEGFRVQGLGLRVQGLELIRV